jgi:hypothetical protein
MLWGMTQRNERTGNLPREAPVIRQAIAETCNFIITRNVADECTWNLGLPTPVNIRPWWGAFVKVYAYHQTYTANAPSFVAIHGWTAGGSIPKLPSPCPRT